MFEMLIFKEIIREEKIKNLVEIKKLFTSCQSTIVEHVSNKK